MSLAQARRPRFGFLAWAVAAGFLVLLGKLVQLHVVDGPRLRAKAVENRGEWTRHASRRGEIRDRQGNLLAASDRVWDIGLDPQVLAPEERARAPEIARVLGIPATQVLAALDPARAYRPAAGPGQPPREVRWIVLAKEVGAERKRAVDALGIRALYGQPRYVRSYPKGSLAAHVLGYINQEGTPVSGVERTFDDLLSGQDGWTESERDGRRREIVARRLRDVPAVNGMTLELTLDAVIQSAAEQALEAAAAKWNPLGGVAIVTEPRTGRVLALACWPTFDLNRFHDRAAAPLEAQRNRALADIYEPGSVFKVVAVAGALDAGLVTPSSRYDCGLSQVPYRGRMVSLPSDSHPMGVEDVRTIVWESSNRGSVQIGMRYAESLGEQRFHDLVRGFGFGSETGFPLAAGEVRGILHPPSRWDGLTISRLPMGHSVSVTPLQMHQAMAAIAADGLLMRPQVVGRALNPDGSVAFEYAPRPRGRAVSAAAARQMADLLRGVCTRQGTAAAAEIPGHDVAGKTGTTQKLVGGRYSSQHHVASFSGFFPAGDPRVAITVVIDEPRGAGVGYGGRVSAPVFKEIAEACIRRLEIPPARVPQGGRVVAGP
jgi:cell division protein FtsI/penicillin-binding protein 2